MTTRVYLVVDGNWENDVVEVTLYSQGIEVEDTFTLKRGESVSLNPHTNLTFNVKAKNNPHDDRPVKEAMKAEASLFRIKHDSGGEPQFSLVKYEPSK